MFGIIFKMANGLNSLSGLRYTFDTYNWHIWHLKLINKLEFTKFNLILSLKTSQWMIDKPVVLLKCSELVQNGDILDAYLFYVSVASELHQFHLYAYQNFWKN